MPVYKVVLERIITDEVELTVQAEGRQRLSEILEEPDDFDWETVEAEVMIRRIEEYPEPEQFEAADPRQLDLDLSETE